MTDTRIAEEFSKLTDPNPTLADLAIANYAQVASPYDQNTDVGYLRGSAYFAGSALVSAAAQIWNGVDYAARSMADAVPEGMRLTKDKNLPESTAITPRKLLGKATFGSEDVDAFYTRHDQRIDSIGTLIGSIVPGTGAIKGVRGLQALAAGKMVSPGSSLATGLLTNTLEARYVAKAAAAMEAGTSYTASRIAAAAAAAGQGFLEGVAFEIGAMAAMSQSPSYEDVTDFKSFVSRAVSGGLAFGAFSGVVKYGGFLGSDVLASPLGKQVTMKLGEWKDAVGGAFNQAARTHVPGAGVTAEGAASEATIGDVLVSSASARKAAENVASSTTPLTPEVGKTMDVLRRNSEQARVTEELGLYNSLAKGDGVFLQSTLGKLDPDTLAEAIAGATKISRPIGDALGKLEQFINVHTGAVGNKATLLLGDLSSTLKFDRKLFTVTTDNGTVYLENLVKGTEPLIGAKVSEVNAAWHYSKDYLDTTIKDILKSKKPGSPKHLDDVMVDKAAEASAKSVLTTAQASLTKAQSDLAALIAKFQSGGAVSAEEITAAQIKTSAEQAAFDLASDNLAKITSRTVRDGLTVAVPERALPLIEAQIKALGQTKVVDANGVERLLKGQDAVDFLGLAKQAELKGMRDVGLPPEEVMLRLNVTSKFLQSPVRAALEDVAPTAIDPATRTFVVGKYAPDATGNVWVAKGMADVQSRINADIVFHKTIGTNILGTVMPELNLTKVVANDHRFSGFLTSTNPAYGSLLEQVQLAAAKAQKVREKFTNERATAMINSEQALRSAGDNSLTSFVLSSLYPKLRGSSETLYTLEATGHIVGKQVKGSQVNVVETLDIGAILKKHLMDSGVEAKLAEEQALAAKTKVVDYLKAYVDVDAKYVKLMNQLRLAKGEPAIERLDGQIYIPPPPLASRKHAVFVADSLGNKSMLFANSQKELSSKILETQKAHPDLKVFTNKDTEVWFKALDEYEAASVYAPTRLDMAMKRSGRLQEDSPPHGMKILDDINEALTRKEHFLVRGGMESVYAEELHTLGLSARAMSPSGESNAYSKLRDMLLGTSEKSKWLDVQEAIATGFDSGLNTVAGIFRTSKSVVSPKAEEARLAAQDVFSKFNGRDAWASPELWNMSGYSSYNGTTQQLVNSANRFLQTMGLRLEMANSIVGLIGTPIMMFPEIKAALNNDVGFGYLKFIANAVRNYFTDPRRLEWYDSFQAVNKELAAHREVTTSLGALFGAKTSNQILANSGVLNDKLSKAVNTLATPSDWVERFTRYLGADVAHQIGNMRGLQGAELEAFIVNFANKVSGNFVANQRPQLFQGVVGSAIGLFQSYQFNLMQQMFRHLAEGEAGRAAMVMALQGTIFGGRSLPFFDLINNHIFTRHNADKADIYSFAHDTFGEKWGDYLVYGLGSNLTGMNFWQRGDTTPRNFSVVPLLPQDWAVVQKSAQAFEALGEFASNMSNGGSLKVSGLELIAHAGLNRPLAGVAEMALGAKTSKKGNVDVAINHDLLSMATAARLLGARPMDEALTMEQMYRYGKIKADAQEKKNAVMEAMRSQILNDPTELDVSAFAKRYSESGGRPEEFRRSLLKTLKETDTPRAKLFADKIRRDPYAQHYQEQARPNGLENYDPNR